MPSLLGARPERRHALGTSVGTRRAALFVAVCIAAAAGPFPAVAQKVRVTNLSDVDFGLISNLQADARRSQSICLFSNSGGGRYSVTASGSGPGSSFTLSNGSSSLAYDVEWSDQSGQTSGTSLIPTVAATGRVSAATQQTCNSGPPSSASLTIILRSSALSQASEGNYSGSLTLLVAAE
ncbi:MAG TPA: hypothetical protein VGD23_02670 [Sphingomicrobium sp.]